MNEKRVKQGYQMEQIRVKTKITTRQSPENNQRELHIIEDTEQPKRTQWRSANPSFRTPRIISQEALMAFSLAAVGIERRFPIVEDNQDSTDKTMEEVHAPDNLQHFCAPVIHPTTGEIITSYKKLTEDPTLKEVWETGFGK